MQKKDNKIGNKTAYKEERQIKGEKIAGEKDWNRFLKKTKKKTSPKFGLCTCPKNKKQRAKTVVSDSLGLVDFAIGLVVFVLNLLKIPEN